MTRVAIAVALQAKLRAFDLSADRGDLAMQPGADHVRLDCIDQIEA